MRHFEVKVSYTNPDCWPDHITWVWGDGTRAGKPSIRNMLEDPQDYASFVSRNPYAWGEFSATGTGEMCADPEKEYHVFTFLSPRAARSFALRYGIDAN